MLIKLIIYNINITQYVYTYTIHLVHFIDLYLCRCTCYKSRLHNKILFTIVIGLLLISLALNLQPGGPD